MPRNEDKQKTKAKANEKSSRHTRGSHSDQNMDTIIKDTIEKKTGNLELDPKNRDNDLLSKMSGIMKETIQESLAYFKKQVASEIAGVSLTNDECITKLKKELNSKFKAFETKTAKEHKSAIEKIPQIEKSLAAIQEIVSDDTCGKLRKVDDLLPKIESLEMKIDEQVDSHSEIEKSLNFYSDDVKANRSKIEKLEDLISKQQITIDMIIKDNRKLKAKLGELQDLVNTIDNRQRKYNLLFEGITEESKENVKETIKKLVLKHLALIVPIDSAKR